MAVSESANLYAENLAWRLEINPDNSYNIVNKQGNLYLNPDLTDNGEITLSTEVPTVGWDVKVTSSTSTYYTITSGANVQASISTESTGYKVINYSSPISTTNAGCQFRFFDITDLITDTAIPQITVNSNKSEVLYDLHGRRVVNPARHGIYITSDGRRIIL